MKPSSYQSLNSEIKQPEEDTIVVEQPERGFFGWWIRLTGPTKLPRSAPFKQREAIRRGQLASTIMFFLILILCVVLLIGIVGSNYHIISAVSIMLVLVLAAIISNRTGHMNIAGLLLSLGYDAAVSSVILTYPGGLTPSILGLYDMLLIAEICFITLLPLNWVFLSLILNIAFIVGDLLLQPGSASFQAMMSVDRVAVIARPIMLHVIVTAVLYFWILNNQREMMRADVAEDLAALQKERMREKEQLQTGIESIQEALVQAANGDFSVQIPLSQENILWRVANSINTLLARIQRARKDEEQINTFLEQLTGVLQKSLITRRPPILPFPPQSGPTMKLINVLRALMMVQSVNPPTSKPSVPPLDSPPSNRQH